MDEENQTGQVDTTQVEDQSEAAGFASLFNDGPTETPAGNEQTQTPEPAEAAQEPAPPPKLAQITEDQYAELLARAAAVDELKAGLDKKVDTAFGKIGEINRLIASLQQSTPAGEAISLNDDDLAELSSEFPEIAAMTAKGLNRVLSRLKGTGGTSPDIESIVQQRLAPVMEALPTRVEAMVSEKLLAKEHGDWRAIVGKPDEKTEYRAWLSTQPAEYQQTVSETYDSVVIGESLTRFKAEQAKAQAAAEEARKKAEAANQRKSRFEAAATPRGMPGNTPLESDETAGFRAAFSSG